MNADGSRQTNMTNLPKIDDGFPSWSPDGHHIAFVYDRDNQQRLYSFCPMNADDGDPTNLTNNPEADRLSFWKPSSPQGN